MTEGGGERNLYFLTTNFFRIKLYPTVQTLESFKIECIELAIFISLLLKKVYCLKCNILCKIVSFQIKVMHSLGNRIFNNFPITKLFTQGHNRSVFNIKCRSRIVHFLKGRIYFDLNDCVTFNS